jgi:hypothetical protein
VFAATVGLVALALLAPASASALDSDLKGFAAFRVKASNGYSILVLAASERADSRGDVVLILGRPGGSVVYGAPAIVSPTRLEADLGALGRISLDIVPTGAKKSLRSRCGGEPLTLEPNTYQGTFEFHGEEGFTEAEATHIPEYSRFGVDFLCSGKGWGEVSGPGLPGARLRVRAGTGHHHMELQVNKNRPGGHTYFEAGVKEKRGRIEIARSVTGHAPASAFAYDQLVRSATVDPPAPFSGSATFRRSASPANRWSGNLTVDLPGRSDFPLTDDRVRISLVHAKRDPF